MGDAFGDHRRAQCERRRRELVDRVRRVRVDAARLVEKCEEYYGFVPTEIDGEALGLELQLDGMLKRLRRLGR